MHGSRLGRQALSEERHQGMTVCYTHGGAAPQVRHAAAVRCGLLLDPALKALSEIIKDKKHPQRLGAIKEVLERNGLEGFGKPADPKTAIYQPPAQQTQVNVSTYHFEKLSEDELDATFRQG